MLKTRTVRRRAIGVNARAGRETSLSRIVAWANKELRIDEISDYDGALNGLQVENNGRVTRVAAAVDASMATARLAVQEGANLLVVHHGLFWSSRQPWTGSNYELARFLIENNLAVYSSHLPLDLHPRLGNNVRLAKALGFAGFRPFFFTHGQFLGVKAKRAIRRNDLAMRLEKAVGGKVTVLPGGGPMCNNIGIVTGGAGSELKLAAKEGVDTFITGEGPHWTFALAEELGLNVLYGGHYQTETFGVKALASEIAKRFGLSWFFINHPTGL